MASAAKNAPLSPAFEDLTGAGDSLTQQMQSAVLDAKKRKALQGSQAAADLGMGGTSMVGAIGGLLQ